MQSIEELKLEGIEEHLRYSREVEDANEGWDNLFLNILALPNEQLRSSYFHRLNKERGYRN